MSDLFVKNIPSIQEHKFKYRGKSSSHNLNAMQDEAFHDILDLFNKANQLQKTVYEMNLLHGIESSCYTKRLNDAILEIKRLNEQFMNLTDSEKEYRTITKYAYQANVEYDGYAAVVDSNTNDITAHIVSSKSKVRLYDETYDETFVPPSLQAYVGPDSFRISESIYSIEDSNINNAFDGRNDTAWFRKVITNIDTEYIDNEIVIGLPEDIITTRLMNQIIIKPFPSGYVDIMDIQYKSNGSWQTIPGFECHDGCIEKTGTDILGNPFTYKVIENATDLKFNFQNIQTNQIKIKLRQRNYDYDSENNRRIWYLGLKDVDVLFNIYTKDHSEFDMVYDFPETDRDIKIYGADITFNNSNITDDANFGVSKEYFYYDSDDHYHKVPSTCPFILEGHKLRVKYTIEGNQTTPNINKCTIKYKLS